MNKHLEKLALAQGEYIYDDFVNAWIGYMKNPGDIDEYRCIRLDTFQRSIGSTSNKDVACLKTSGQTSGIQKEYKWGPNFTRVERFFDLIRTDGLTANRKIYIQVSPSPGSPFLTEEPLDWVSRHAVSRATINPLAKGSVKDLGEAILWITPSTFDIANHYGIDLAEDIDPQRQSVYMTGEYVPVDLEKQLNKFGIAWRDAMRCWDGGATFYTCRYGKRHWMPLLADVAIVNGHLISTDLFNTHQPFIEYWNGDLVREEKEGTCLCGLPSISLDWTMNGRNTIEIAGKVISSRLFWTIVQSVVKKTLGPTPLRIEHSNNRLLLFVKCQCVGSEDIRRELEEIFGSRLDVMVFQDEGIERIAKNRLVSPIRQDSFETI